MASEDLFGHELDEEFFTDTEQLPDSNNAFIAKNKECNEEQPTSGVEVQCATPSIDGGEPVSADAVLPECSGSGNNKVLQLPLSRIRSIMKLDPDVQVINQDIVFLMARCTELFIESLTKESYKYTLHGKRKTIQVADVNLAISAVDSLMFLSGTMDI